jgi:hypothetical protein
MIVRAWKAQALSQNVEAYARRFREAVLPELEEISGHAGAYFLRRDAGTHAFHGAADAQFALNRPPVNQRRGYGR